MTGTANATSTLMRIVGWGPIPVLLILLVFSNLIIPPGHTNASGYVMISSQKSTSHWTTT